MKTDRELVSNRARYDFLRQTLSEYCISMEQ